MAAGTGIGPSERSSIAAFTMAYHCALQTLVMLLEDSGVLKAGQFAAGLREYIDAAGDDMDPLTVALLDELSMFPRGGSSNSGS